MQEGGTALWLACHLGHTEMVRYMLSVCDKFDITATLQVTRMLAPLRLFIIVVLFCFWLMFFLCADNTISLCVSFCLIFT